jgi:phosphopantetheine adenylyltransferase
MALMNRRLEPAIETVFMMPAETYSYVSSRLVKEVFSLGLELTAWCRRSSNSAWVTRNNIFVTQAVSLRSSGAN